LAEHQATDEQIERATQRFKGALNTVLTRYARQKHVVILNKNLMLAGGADITHEIAGLLSADMRKKS
jgi:hypothetical protein